MRGPAPRFKDALELLSSHGVEYIVVGGVAAVLAGAPISTFDLDIVHDRSAPNLDRLMTALAELDARYRDPAGRILRPEAAALAGPGHHLLMTRFGPLDVLGEIGAGNDHAGLVAHSDVLSIGNLSVRVLGLPALIRAKEQAGRPKDLAVLDILRQTLAESTKR